LSFHFPPCEFVIVPRNRHSREPAITRSKSSRAGDGLHVFQRPAGVHLFEYQLTLLAEFAHRRTPLRYRPGVMKSGPA
jgi:hypothetical protein